jgi:formate dehydrogenase subunit delta
MDHARLVYMANQIARNLAPQGEARAIELTAQHLRDYWDRRMKAEIRACDAAQLHPIARAAVALLDS